MWNRITYTWDVMSHSWELIKADKKLLVFPVLSSISCLMVLATFLVPLSHADLKHLNLNTPVTYAILFAYYFCNYFVIVFFNSALIGCASLRMAGHEHVPLSSGFDLALRRIHLIAGWSLLSASVGMLLQVLENAHEKGSEILGAILGIAWTLMTFLAVPALVVDGLGPVEAAKASTRLLKKTWGEQLVGEVSFGLVFGLLGMLPMIVMILGIAAFATGRQVTGAIFVLGALLAIVLLAVIQSAMKVIFQTTLYLYFRDDKLPQGIDPALLRA